MELKEFKIFKNSGTYAETIEAYGVANLIDEILKRNEVIASRITIEDNDLFYLIKVNKPITSGMINSLKYFPIVKFIKKDENTKIPVGIIEYFNYPEQKKIRDEYNESYKSIHNNNTLSQEQKKVALRNLNNKKYFEFGEKFDFEYEVYREIKSNPYLSFLKLFDNFHQNQDNFPILIKEILSYYCEIEKPNRTFRLSEEKPTAQQLYNPNQGKGLNKNKANNASMGNVDSNWISETMKISGALTMMDCQMFKVGSNFDLKLIVPEFHQISLLQAQSIFFEYKKHTKKAGYLRKQSAIRLDIVNILTLSINFIMRTPEYNRGKIKNTIKGFYTAYQKKLGGPTKPGTVTNIAFINTPDFISYSTREEGKVWLDILENQKGIISGIEELGDSIQGLQSYRNFLGSTGKSAIENFHKFSFWYSGYLTQALSNEKFYVKPFHTETLNKFYINMNTTELNLKEIIENEGFKAVAKAIRKSTVSLQYTPKDQRKFEIRYGLAQQLQNKSKSKEDLATFIGEFIGLYNAETARYAEKNNNASRATVKDLELNEFFEILNQKSSRLVGALLASYGFALTKKESPIIEDEEPLEESLEEN